MSKINEYEQNFAEIWQKESQAGAELGQAQHQLELGFTLIKVCNIQLMIRNFHYISTYLHTSLLTCMLACLLTFLYTCLQRRPSSPLLTVNSNRSKSHSSHTLNFRQIYLVNILAWVGWVSSMQCHSNIAFHQKSPTRLSTS